MASTFVYGAIINANTQQLLAQGTVSCPDYTVSNSDGSYSCTVTTEGTYSFTGSCPGYQDKTVDLTCNGGNLGYNFHLTPN